MKLDKKEKLNEFGQALSKLGNTLKDALYLCSGFIYLPKSLTCEARQERKAEQTCSTSEQ